MLQSTLTRIKKLEEKIKGKTSKYKIFLDFENDPSMSKAIKEFDTKYPNNKDAETWLVNELVRAFLSAYEEVGQE